MSTVDFETRIGIDLDDAERVTVVDYLDGFECEIRRIVLTINENGNLDTFLSGRRIYRNGNTSATRIIYCKDIPSSINSIIVTVVDSIVSARKK